MDPTLTDTIDMHGDPLAFRLRAGRASAADRNVIKVEARQLAGHQKEAVVSEGENAAAWRLTSDEGRHLRGTDLAPFPLGFFNAGMQADLYGRIRTLAAARDIVLDDLEIRLVNHYWLTGSFIHGTGEGHAEAPDIEVRVESSAGTDAIEALVAAAADASPAIALIRTPLAGNTFALYINGRRRQVAGVASSAAPDPGDPYRVHARAPRPLDQNSRRDLIEKTGRQEPGTSAPAAPTVAGKLVRNIFGTGKPLGRGGLFAVDTWLGMPGASHYRLLSDEGEGNDAPCGLALLSAGIAFCYMTQLSRYIENMKLGIRAVRLVQFNPYTGGPRAALASEASGQRGNSIVRAPDTRPEPGSSARAAVEPIDTHLYLNGDAPEATHLKLLTIAARTCYLHAASKTPIEPNLRIVHNGRAIARAA